ncbi:hypothetical protein [Streptomyces sp. NPDC047841]|uniref:hypothetical protein n=1 Tax=Streptomyces sp. NPDC047841 TaxID=3154708 RepID=UPI003454EA87
MDSASALSALVPIALVDWRTSALRQASAKARLVYCLGSVVGVHDRSGEAAAGAFGGGQGVDDGTGSHVIRDGSSGQAT